MAGHLYLSIFPEALVASMLPPDVFGNYYAVGDKKRTRGQAMFIELDPDQVGGGVDLPKQMPRCVPHPDGSPKRSVYLSIYRVLEHVPRSAMRRLYLVTDDGRVLGLDPAEWSDPVERRLHLYQDLAPNTTRAVSLMGPAAFARHMTNRDQPVSVPRIAFAELRLGELAVNPLGGAVHDLPYPNVDHLRDCLQSMLLNPHRATKTVIRFMHGTLFYRTIRNGVFVGDADGLLYFPLPSQDELEMRHYAWWRSAQATGFAYS